MPLTYSQRAQEWAALVIATDNVVDAMSTARDASRDSAKMTGFERNTFATLAGALRDVLNMQPEDEKATAATQEGGTEQEPAAEPEQAEPEQAEPEQAEPEPEQADDTPAEPEKPKRPRRVARK